MQVQQFRCWDDLGLLRPPSIPKECREEVCLIDTAGLPRTSVGHHAMFVVWVDVLSMGLIHSYLRTMADATEMTKLDHDMVCSLHLCQGGLFCD